MNDDGTFLLSTASTSDELLRLSNSNNDNNGASRAVDVTGTSTALIENVIHIAALSGDNAVMNGESALITSGNAYAGANIINIANANVLGRNWILAIVNIFGDFNGDIAFGRPDLWVGERVVTPSPFHNGDSPTYRFTVINNGDAKSSNVTLRDKVDATHLDILASSIPYRLDESGLLVWDLGVLPPSGAVELTLTVRIKDAPPGTEIPNEISVSGIEAESIMANNKDRTTISTYVAPQFGGGGSASQGEQMVIVITPRNSGSAIAPSPAITSSTKSSTSTPPEILPLLIMRSTATSSIADMDVKSPQAIIIRNPNNTKVESVIFQDILRDPEGVILSTETWELDTLLPNEEIAIGYDIAFGKHASTGTYVLSSTISRAGIVDAFPSNGRIFLNIHKVKEIQEIQSSALPPRRIAVSPDTTTQNTDSVSAFVDAVLLVPETAHAEGIVTSEDSLLRTKLRGPQLAYFLLPMFVTILYIAMRRTKTLG